MLKLAEPPRVEPTDQPRVDLWTVIASIEDRLPVIDDIDRGDRPLAIGALHPLLSDALIYLKRYHRMLRDAGPRDYGES